jgi:hypothetical protein
VSIASPLTTGFTSGLYARLGVLRNPAAEVSLSWSPSFTVGVHILRSPWIGAGRDASFYVTAGDATFCPSVVVVAAMRWRPCVNLEGGMLYARGENISNPQRSQVQRLSTGALLEVELAFSRALGLSARVGAQVELYRHTFDVGVQPRVLAESRPISPWFSLGLVTHF